MKVREDSKWVKTSGRSGGDMPNDIRERGSDDSDEWTRFQLLTISDFIPFTRFAETESDPMLGAKQSRSVVGHERTIVYTCVRLELLIHWSRITMADSGDLPC